MERRCENCEWFNVYFQPKPPRYGECRRFPPGISLEKEGDWGLRWPNMFLSDWCGEFQPTAEQILKECSEELRKTGALPYKEGDEKDSEGHRQTVSNL